MSGRKCSTIRFDAAREQRRQLLNQIESDRRTVEGIRNQVTEALRGTSEGVREHFAKETLRAQQWIEQAERVLATSQPLSLGSNLSDISQQANESEAVVKDGGEIQERLQEAFMEEAGQLRAEGARQIFAVESLLSRGQSLIGSWFGSGEVQRIQEVIRELHQGLGMDRLGEVSRLASSLQLDVKSKLELAEANESKYQHRLYVLKALRQVCAEMGFKEVGPPKSERPDDRKSRIALTVDTFNRGQVTFHLSLESIEADSCISQSHCFEEFAQLSDQLAETFGVVTRFQMADGESPDKLIRKGELEEPGGAEGTVGARPE